VSLVVFALAEVILFAWIFGMTKGWDEINSGSDIKLPSLYKPIIKYVTPVILLAVFIGAFITPKNNDWIAAFKNGWELDNGSVLSKVTNSDIKANKEWFSDHKEFDMENGLITSIDTTEVEGKEMINIEVSANQTFYVNESGVARPTTKRELLENLGKKYTFIEDSLAPVKTYSFASTCEVKVKEGEEIKLGDTLVMGEFTNKSFYITIGRLLLLSLFIGICILVYKAGKNKLA